MAEALARVEAFIAEGRPHQIATVNPEFIVEAQRNAPFRVALERADLSLPDGVGLLLATRVLRQPLRERVAGSDMVPKMARLSAQKGYRLYLLGAAPGVAERAAAALVRDCPGLQIAGAYAGTPEPRDEDDIVARIVAADPDVLLVAYGAPRQDLWIYRNLHRLGVPVCMGVGGALDFVAGVAVRAPRWMQRAGLEWLHRLWRQPWRWRRMLALPRFVALVIQERLVSGARGE